MKQIKFYHLIILSTLIIYTINSCNTIYEKNDYIPLEAEVARITESEQAINVVEYSSISDNKNEREDIIRRVSIDKKNNREVMSLSNDALK